MVCPRRRMWLRNNQNMWNSILSLTLRVLVGGHWLIKDFPFSDIILLWSSLDVSCKCGWRVISTSTPDLHRQQCGRKSIVLAASCITSFSVTSWAVCGVRGFTCHVQGRQIWTYSHVKNVPNRSEMCTFCVTCTLESGWPPLYSYMCLFME